MANAAMVNGETPQSARLVFQVLVVIVLRTKQNAGHQNAAS